MVEAIPFIQVDEEYSSIDVLIIRVVIKVHEKVEGSNVSYTWESEKIKCFLYIEKWSTFYIIFFLEMNI